VEENFKLNDIDLVKHADRRTKVDALLLKYFDIFSDGSQIGKTTMATHFINTSSEKPIAFPPRRVNPKIEQKQNEQIELWLQQDVIEESNSQYAFPLIPVPKKDGGIRLCVDYRRLNDVTFKDSFPLPNIVDNLDKLAGSTIFSALDNFGAFHSVPINEDDRHKTAFTSPTGLYQFKFMPFGLMNGPPTYSRLIKLVLKNVPMSMAIPYLDDCCVHSADFDSHLTALEAVFQAYQTAGLKLKPSKCKLFQTSLTYLGHDVSAAGVEISKEYVKIIQTWPEPASPAEIRTFLGKMGYYRKFIEKFSHIAQPLAVYLKDLEPKDKKKTITLSEEARMAFLSMKKKLQEAPILAYPDFSSKKPFILDTDWSFDHKCIGAVLSQEQNGKERVIAYAARKLRKSEINYSSHKGELLAALEYMKYWKHYLLNGPFILRTDHEALRWIKTMAEPKGMILRWLETLADFDFKVQYRKGTLHGNADALSRTDHATIYTTENIESPRLLALLPDTLNVTEEDVKTAQINDPILSQTARWLRNSSTMPTRHALRAAHPNVRHYAKLFHCLSFNEQGLISLADDDKQIDRICLPDSLQEKVISKIHSQEAAHKALDDTVQRVFRFFYFPAMNFKVRTFIAKCLPCIQKRAKLPPQRHTLVSQPTGYPFQRISIDLVGPFYPATSRGNTYILTCKDLFTKWVEAIPMPDATAHNILHALMTEIFARHGMCETVISDNGPQFISNALTNSLKAMGITHQLIPEYNARSNPVERSHRDLNDALRALVKDNVDWEQCLGQAILAIRTAWHRSTGISPFEALYGRPSITPTQLQMGLQPLEMTTLPLYVAHFIKKLQGIHQEIRDHTDEANKISSKQFQQKKPIRKFRKDDIVYIYYPKPPAGIPPKFGSHWYGPRGWFWKRLTNSASELLLMVDG
jgi:hypothetical protein